MSDVGVVVHRYGDDALLVEVADHHAALALYAALRTGLEGPRSEDKPDAKRERTRFLPDNIYDAIRLFKGSKFMEDLLGAEVHDRYVSLKTMQAIPSRAPPPRRSCATRRWPAWSGT